MDALCLNQRYVERPKPTREPQLPGVGNFSSGLNFPEMASLGLFTWDNQPIGMACLGRPTWDSLPGPPDTIFR